MERYRAFKPASNRSCRLVVTMTTSSARATRTLLSPSRTACVRVRCPVFSRLDDDQPVRTPPHSHSPRAEESSPAFAPWLVQTADGAARAGMQAANESVRV